VTRSGYRWIIDDALFFCKVAFLNPWEAVGFVIWGGDGEDELCIG
jgi:hypothetical protein